MYNFPAIGILPTSWESLFKSIQLKDTLRQTASCAWRCYISSYSDSTMATLLSRLFSISACSIGKQEGLLFDLLAVSYTLYHPLSSYLFDLELLGNM